MAAQTSYGFGTAKGVPGGKYDLAFDEVVTRANQEDDGKMKFGVAVIAGTVPGKNVKLPVAGTTAEKFEGVTIALPNTEVEMNGKVVLKKNATLGVMKKGNIWGRIGSGVTPVYGKTAYVVLTGADAGSFTTESANNLDVGAMFGSESDEGIAVIVL